MSERKAFMNKRTVSLRISDSILPGDLSSLRSSSRLASRLHTRGSLLEIAATARSRIPYADKNVVPSLGELSVPFLPVDVRAQGTLAEDRNQIVLAGERQFGEDLAFVFLWLCSVAVVIIAFLYATL